jgi:hypothetical protein
MYSTGFYPYEIDNSARLGTNSYYTRTPSSAGNRKTWTWSSWVKRGNLNTSTTYQQILNAGTASLARDSFFFDDDTDDTLMWFGNYGGTGYGVKTTAVFRDPSAWYHIVWIADTTQATASNRLKLYVNGVQQALSTAVGSGFLPQNTDMYVNSTIDHFIGKVYTTSEYLDGYLAEVNFIDGQALDATSFGEFKSGVWIPKSYSGTYGTNGFYLDFATRATDPIDASGNGNNWGSVNVVSTDWMLDSPTNNFPTLNPLYGPLITYSEGNLRFYYGGAYAGTAPTMYTGKNQKYYSEELIVALGGDKGIAVIADNEVESIGWIYNGNTYGSLAAGFVMPSYTTGDIIGYAVDGTTNQVQFYKNGVAAGSAWQFSTAKPISFITHAGYMYGGSDCVANFGQDSSFAGNKTAQGNTDANGIGDFYYAPPAGYLALCTANLPDPVIDPAQDDVPADYFNTVLYTGNGSTQSITGVGFQPDFVWAKDRTAAANHRVFDSVRGNEKIVYPSLTNAEATDANGLTSFDADGFSVGSTQINDNTNSFVAWNWLAGNGTSSNTDGTITSTVSANQKAGFSIISWTGDGSDGTVGHGLSQKPEITIRKRRDSTGSWAVIYNADLTGGSASVTNYMWLNTSDAADVASQAPATSTTMGVYNTYDSISSATYIAYCFHSVEGYSKIGRYTGNGSTDGPFVYTGFRPAFVMMKVVDLSGGFWTLHDSARDEYNESQKWLFPNSSSAEQTATYSKLDFLSNGFKIRSAPPDNINYSGNTFIYMAFSEMPFKYANAR